MRQFEDESKGLRLDTWDFTEYAHVSRMGGHLYVSHLAVAPASMQPDISRLLRLPWSRAKECKVRAYALFGDAKSRFVADLCGRKAGEREVHRRVASLTYSAGVAAGAVSLFYSFRLSNENFPVLQEDGMAWAADDA